jgi:hypothetical protein
MPRSLRLLLALGAAALDLYFQYNLNPWRCHREIRLWLNNDKRLFPGPNHPDEQYQEYAIRFGPDGPFDLSAQDDQRLSQEGVFCHEFGLPSGKVSHGPQQERSVGWIGPVDEAVLKRLKAHACQSFDEGENRMHSLRFLL